MEDKASAPGTLKAGKAHWTECSPFLVGFDGTQGESASLVGRATGDDGYAVLLGMILGVLITIGTAYVYDSGTGRVANGLTVASADCTHPWSTGTW